MKEKEILTTLRSLYAKKRYKEFREAFFRGAFYISKERRSKILRIIDDLPKGEQGQNGEKGQKGEQGDNLIDFAVNELGWKLVKRDKTGDNLS